MPFMKQIVTAGVLAALLGCAVPAAASASATHDFTTEITNTSPLSAKVREATITLTNHGPDPFIGCNDGLDCYLGGSVWEEPHIAISMQVQPDEADDFTAATTSSPCTAFPEGIQDQIRCNFGRSLAVGQSVSVDVSFPAGTGSGDDFLYAGVNWSEEEELTEGETGTQDPDWENDHSSYTWPDGGSCELQAKGPQKANKALVVTVFGGTSGCAAKLKAAKLKIGNKVYTFIKKKPAKDVAPGEKWKVSIPIKGQDLTTVNKALAAKKKVKAAAEFDLDGKSDSIVVKIK